MDGRILTVRSGPALEPGRCTSRGFTIVELTVASIVMGMVLLGVYGLFSHVVTVEGQASMRSDEQEAALAVVEHFQETLRRAVNLAGEPSVVYRKDKDLGLTFLTCWVGPGGVASDYTGHPCLERRQYCWGFAEGDGEGTVELRTIPWGGSANLLPIDNSDELEEEQLWDCVAPRIIARGVKSLTINFMPVADVGDPEAKWKGSWSGPVGQVVVRISVGWGSAKVERTLLPQVNGGLLGQGGE